MNSKEEPSVDRNPTGSKSGNPQQGNYPLSEQQIDAEIASKTMEGGKSVAPEDVKEAFSKESSTEDSGNERGNFGGRGT